MSILEKIPPSVLIYMQNIKKFFTTNEEVRTYFNINSVDDEFFDYVIEQSIKNYEELGCPLLNYPAQKHSNSVS